VKARNFGGSEEGGTHPLQLHEEAGIDTMRDDGSSKNKVSVFPDRLLHLLRTHVSVPVSDPVSVVIGAQKKLSWSKTLVRKWFNIKTKAKDFHSDYAAEEGTLTFI
jgi:hypothetical protein